MTRRLDTRTRSLLGRWLLALILLAGQSAGLLHALEHVVPHEGDGAHADLAHPAPGTFGHETSPGAHADDDPCALCLSLGGTLALGEPTIGLPPVDTTAVVADGARSGPAIARGHDRPPPRGPPTLH